MKNNDGSGFARRDALKATAGVVGGLALGSGLGPPVAAQSTYYQYDEMEALIVNIDADPLDFRRVRTSLFISEPILADCNADHPCSIDVLDFESTIDTDDDDDNDDDDDDDNDDSCPDYAGVVLLCHGETVSESIALTGLVLDVLSQNSEGDYDYVVKLTPTDDTNVTDPETASNPCPAYDDDDTGNTGGGDDNDDDSGGDDDDENDD